MRDFNPRGRKDLDKVIGSIEQFDDISIHEVAKTSTVQAVVAAEYLENFNPRGRKDLDMNWTGTIPYPIFQSTRSQRPRRCGKTIVFAKVTISIHEVAKTSTSNSIYKLFPR